MSFASILVHVDSSPRASARIALAATLARRLGARLTGLFAELADAHHVGAVATWPSDKYVADRDAAQAAFAAATAALGDRAAFLDANRGGEAEVTHRVVAIARCFDLVVLGQSEEGAPVPAKLPEHVITDSGRPALVVPYVGTYPEIGRRPLFAWHSSRGAARAMADALPLLQPGAEALVVEVGRHGDQRDEFSDLIHGRLAAHGVKSRYQHFVVDEIDVMDTLLSAASDDAADLMAIGAFDSGALALIGRGAGTRYVLQHMTLPTLFSH